MITQKPICLKIDNEVAQILEEYQITTGRKNRNRIINDAITWYCQEQTNNFKKKQKTLDI